MGDNKLSASELLSRIERLRESEIVVAFFDDAKKKFKAAVLGTKEEMLEGKEPEFIDVKIEGKKHGQPLSKDELLAAAEELAKKGELEKAEADMSAQERLEKEMNAAHPSVEKIKKAISDGADPNAPVGDHGEVPMQIALRIPDEKEAVDVIEALRSDPKNKAKITIEVIKEANDLERRHVLEEAESVQTALGQMHALEQGEAKVLRLDRRSEDF